MALVNFGGIVVELRNSIGTTNFSRNKSGSYARTKPVSPYHVSALQDTWSNEQSFLGANWTALTEEQRMSWVNGAKQYGYSDVFGNTRYLSGCSLYVRQNLHLFGISAAYITTFVPPPAVPSVILHSIEINRAAQQFFYYATPNNAPADYTFLIRATPIINAGSYYIKNKLRIIGTAPASLNDSDQWTQYEAFFGVPNAGFRIGASLMLVHNLSGYRSPVQMASAIVNP